MAVVEYNRQKALAEYKQELTEWHEKQKIEMAKSRLEDVSTKAERYKVYTHTYMLLTAVLVVLEACSRDPTAVC
jgi:cytochrome c-type biogenesis protein CcmH/NrfG